ncbi:CaiB/BaiF CoA-transferase family protein [Limnohabitans sp. B9-3]|uniref:CaiB/BaiF CoA transferase family protein n=1 Tax=Limnohabitans sp. B9-3 TaxID=1100707 RepID=UPI000C1DFAFE|nr:CaiB/BaiF CoA-transferase family protein [Limnohabitans sp. B9-3]PIT77523.1 carnitine dehydratase [Limnohabitans sp. B9-3]
MSTHSSHSHAAGVTHQAPLHGVRVLDLTRLLPGPMCGLHLGDLGAEVIKVEDTGAGDYAAEAVRQLVNRNKRSICIDLKQASGVALLLSLCAQADVLIEGFRPGVMARLGVGYSAVQAVNPKLVYCSISGYGQTGPDKDAPGHDVNYSALAGVADQMGTAQDLALSNVPVADLLGGTMTAVMGILAALFDASRTGKGRHVDVAIADGVLAHAVVPLAGVNVRGSTKPAGADKLTGELPCYATYRTRDARFVAVGALEKKFWDTFCDLIERADLKPLHHPLTPEQSQWVRDELSRLIGAHTWAYWRDKLDGADCCVTPVLKLEESLSHPQFVARGMVLPGVTAAGQPFVQFGSPVQMTDFDFAIRHPAPKQGQHTQEILLQAGYTHDEVDALLAQGTVA